MFSVDISTTISHPSPGIGAARSSPQLGSSCHMPQLL